MANRYANLIGGNKIKDEYKKINEGFDKVQEEMDAEVAAREFLEDRVDTIIQGGGPDKDAELVDIRTPDPAYTPERTINVAGDITRDMQAQFTKYTGRVFNVKGFGAKGDGVTDDTAAIQAVFDSVPDSGGTVYFPDGTYLIDAITGIKPKSNTTIILSPGATLKAIPNSSDHYNVLLIQTVSNVHVFGGGTVEGERSTHTGSTGEWGIGISIRGSNNITIENITCKDCWGDGIYIGDDGTNGCTDVKIINCICDNNRRQGMSITALQRGFVLGGEYKNTNGTAPQSGIDIEPNAPYVVEDVLVLGVKSFNNAGYGILLYGSGVKYNTIQANTCIQNTLDGIRLGSCEENKVIGNICRSNLQHGIKIDSTSGVGGSTSKNVIANNSCINNSLSGITLSPGVAGTAVNTNVIANNHCLMNGQDGIELNGNSVADVDYNEIIGNECNNNARYGLNLTHAANCVVNDNIFMGNADAGVNLNALSTVGNVITGNITKGNLYGINMFQASYNIIDGNQVRANNQHGLRIRSTSNHNVITNNFCMENGQAADNTYDNIFIDNDADFNLVQGNTCRRGALTNKSRYGIRVNSSNCDSNLILGNDCYDGGTTNGISNAGTSTSFGAGNRNKDGTFSTTPN